MSSLAPALASPAVQLPLDGRPLSCSESLFLKQLGDRLRTSRLGRKLSRRELARRSGISERYIARIEGGTGNVSVVLLLRIAQAMRTGEAHGADAALSSQCWESWF